jgi:uncharacterized membrane protein YeiH
MNTPPLTPATLLLTLDIVGTFVFAMSGAAAGVKKRLDLFGVCGVAFVAATAGGLTRDVQPLQATTTVTPTCPARVSRRSPIGPSW